MIYVQIVGAATDEPAAAPAGFGVFINDAASPSCTHVRIPGGDQPRKNTYDTSGELGWGPRSLLLNS